MPDMPDMPEEGGDAVEDIRIGDEEIDVKEIMSRIDRRISSRAGAPEYVEEPLEELDRKGRRVEKSEMFRGPMQELALSLQFARTYAEVTADYAIGSRRKVVGPLIALVKRVMRKLMRPYMEAVFQQQREFNRQLLQIVEQLNQLILRDRARSHPGQVNRLEFLERWGPDFDGSVEMLGEAASLFRGFSGLVELGAGRGEFLEAARRAGIEATGIEGDPDLAAACQERGLSVILADPLDYLEQAPPKSIPAVFARELGERGAAQDLHYALTLMAGRLEKGALAVFINRRPTSFFGAEAAFRDPTVMRLIHPETLVFLLKQAGFAGADFRPYPGGEEGKAQQAREAAAKALAELEKDAPGIGAAWEEFTAPALYLVEARR